ncbi:hypothetical protein Ctob_000922 [Chrysochromulina tobinii]|uniref:Uncharacterized protein n=1 Tax=Chrysochromulina tobinii TaxID=1460289 RepID=A0A0M0J2V5_9EUKA|nr:hypothetical protein Ctob_000922 [Chrysochromulina tobinii]|eukprot:KOO20889.1 hypothetical protein Ctob_000922 [Chrysochromulina sp. CCMP291]
MAAKVVVELKQVAFVEASRYFVTLLMVGNDGTQIQERTDVQPPVSDPPSKTPSFNKNTFEFEVPADADAALWSLQVSAIAVLPDPDASASGANSRTKTDVVGAAVLALQRVIEPMVQSGQVEQTLTLSPPTQSGSGAAVGTIKLKMRLEQPSAFSEPELPSVPPVRQASQRPRQPPSTRAPAPAGGASDDLSRELVHQQELVQLLMADVANKTASTARTGEEVMELRAVNKQLEAELHALRTHVDERELEQLNAQVAQLSAALGTQQQLSASYAKLKEAHTEQAQELQRLQDEGKRLHKYRTTAKQQELIIQRLEALMAAALKDAKRLKQVEPQLGAQTKRAEELAAELARAEADAHERERELTMQLQDAQKKLAGRDEDEMGGAVLGGAKAEEVARLLMRAEKSERRAAALEEEMTDMARSHGREIAALKMKVAEAEAAAKGGFGSAANLALGELPPAPRPPSGK